MEGMGVGSVIVFSCLRFSLEERLVRHKKGAMPRCTYW
jgi:hypothetical protein